MEEGGARTVLLGDGRDEERYLRVTWHPDSQTVVFSHWQGPICAASTPVQLADAARLVDLLVGALRQAGASRRDDTAVMRVPVGFSGARPGRGEATGRVGGIPAGRAAGARGRSGAYEGGE